MGPSARRELAPRGTYGGQGGFTLVELMVTMGVLSIFMAMMAGIFETMNMTTSKTVSIGQTSSQLYDAFLRVDKEMRYAAAINQPGQSGTDWYVEFQSTYTGVPVCTQLRVDTASQQFQQRTWTETGSPITASAWTPLATSIVNNPTTQVPFAFTPTSGSLIHQRLTIYLVDASGSSPNVTDSASSINYSALNTSPLTVTNTPGQLVCTEVPRS